MLTGRLTPQGMLLAGHAERSECPAVMTGTEWYAECFADILNPDGHTGQKMEIIHEMMRDAGQKCRP